MLGLWSAHSQRRADGDRARAGALKRIQPWTETLEIGMYAGMFVLAALFYPA